MSECPCVATAAPIPEQIIFRKFIEIPREFIDIYRIFQGLLFAFCASRASSGRRPDSCGQHPLKNQRQTGGLSSIPHRRDSPPTTNAGRCVFVPVGEGPFRTRQEEWTDQGGKAPGWFFNSPNARGIDATDEDQFRPGRKELLRRPGRGSAGTGLSACPWSPLSSFETTPRRTRKGIGVACMRRVSESVSGLPRLSGRARRRPCPPP